MPHPLLFGARARDFAAGKPGSRPGTRLLRALARTLSYHDGGRDAVAEDESKETP